MSELLLERYCYSETETEGRLYLSDDDYDHVYTLERPWLPGLPGGVPYESCVPDGTYELLSHRRPSGDDVLALRNPALGVYHTPQERAGRPGRDLILIHSGNVVAHVVGCIAPGMTRTIYDNQRFVGRSRDAMRRIMAGRWTSITIRPALGTEDA